MLAGFPYYCIIQLTMAKTKEVFICSDCGARFSQWKGQCTTCQAWNTLQSAVLSSESGRSGQPRQSASKLTRLADARESTGESLSSGLGALDRVLGRGLTPGAAVLVGGEPGIGKSTLLLQVAGAVAAAGGKVVYFSGEESLPQLKKRAERLGVLHEGLLAIAGSQVEDVFAELEGPEPPRLLIADSVQTLSSPLAEGLPGNVSQVRAVATELVERCKRSDTTLFLVGHVTKDGALAGPKLLEHMVDTVISLEGERHQMFRLLRVLKNRFGPNHELLIFQMSGQGMELVEDPSTFFLGTRDPSLPGAALAMAVDGQRPFVVEVQALAAKSYLGIPRRAALGLDVNRLHLILAVLEKRLHLNFGQSDIYVKISGGLRPQDPGLDLALVAGLLSSFYDLPVPENAIFWGEVDLNGQIRPVNAQAVRRDQAARLGYKPLFYPAAEGVNGGLRALNDLTSALFGARKKARGRE